MVDRKDHEGKSAEELLTSYRLDQLTKAIADINERRDRALKELEADITEQIKELHREFSSCIKDLNNQISNGIKTQVMGLKIDVAVLKTRASWWGAIWGGLSGLVIALITLMSKIMEKVGVKP